MRIHPFYHKYPRKGVDNIGAPEGYFDNLGMYCGMAFDSKGDKTPLSLCSDGKDNSLFIWSRERMYVLKKKDAKLDSFQLHAVAYLWEICHDLLLATNWGECVGKITLPREYKLFC